MELSAVPADPDLSPLGTGAFAVAEIRDDWTFELRGITGPRRFRLTFSTPVSGWGLKAVLMRGRDVTDTLIGNLLKDFEPLNKGMAEFARIPDPLPHGRPFVEAR